MLLESKGLLSNYFFYTNLLILLKTQALINSHSLWEPQTWPFGYFKLRSHLVPEHGARERFLMGTNVSTPFFQVPTPEFRH